MIEQAAPRPAQRSPGRSWGQLAVTGVLVALAAALVTGLFSAVGTERLGFDFRAAYYPAGEAILDGTSPYPSDPTAPGLDSRTLYAYPPQLAVLVAPLTAFSVDVAAVLAVLGSLACMVGALVLVGVRDVRCYAAVVIWASGWNALEMANASALLVLLLALVWRFRDAVWPFALALGAMISLKLFLWPLLVWAAVTGRIRGAVLALVAGATLTASSWALIGFDGLDRFRDLLERVAEQESYSIATMAREAGLDSSAGYAIAAAVAGSLIAWCVLYARSGDHERAFVVSLAAALAVSPVLWLHYLVLLAVPLGIARPRFSVLWLVPIVLWVCPRAGNGDGLEVILPATVTAIVLGSLILNPRESRVTVTA